MRSRQITAILVSMSRHIRRPCKAKSRTSADCGVMLAPLYDFLCVRLQVYEPFCEDFGPLNLGQTYRFCWKLETLRVEASRLGKRVYFWTTQEAQRKSNAAVLVRGPRLRRLYFSMHAVRLQTDLHGLLAYKLLHRSLSLIDL